MNFWSSTIKGWNLVVLDRTIHPGGAIWTPDRPDERLGLLATVEDIAGQ